MPEVLISATAAQAFRKLSPKSRERIRTGLLLLQDDPTRRRPGADIKPLAGTHPPKHRLRLGQYRIVCRIEKEHAKVLDIFLRPPEHKKDVLALPYDFGIETRPETIDQELYGDAE
jgi:mRNA-degrading endonuclease RelE of RelBE toxin-antitoxin system